MKLRSRLTLFGLGHCCVVYYSWSAASEALLVHFQLGWALIGVYNILEVIYLVVLSLDAHTQLKFLNYFVPISLLEYAAVACVQEHFHREDSAHRVQVL